MVETYLKISIQRAREKDFVAARGVRIQVETYRPLDGRRRFRGLLLAFDDGIARVDVDGDEFGIPFDEVAKAKVLYEFTRADFVSAAQSR